MSKPKSNPNSRTAEPHEPEHSEKRNADEQHAVELSEHAAELVRAIEQERDEAIGARQRALADFANFQRRAAENERRARQDAAAALVRSILPVLDHFDLALNQDVSKITVEQLLGGVKIVHQELGQALQAHGVERVEPAPNDEFDPNRHEAMMRQPSEEIDAGRVVSVLQPGYAMGDHVLRPAKVAIAAQASGAEGSGD